MPIRSARARCSRPPDCATSSRDSRGARPRKSRRPQIVAPDFKGGWIDSPLNYIAVDAQYFAAAVIPQKPKPTDVLFAKVKPIRVGAVPEEKGNLKLMNVSFRLDSTISGIRARAARRWSTAFRFSPAPRSRRLARALRRAGHHRHAGRAGVLRLVWLGGRADAGHPARVSSTWWATTAWRSSCSRCWCAAACSR